MISLIEARRFRCLKYIHQSLGPFQVLVGPNASGKTTFLDVVSFLGSFVSEGLEAALKQRTRNFLDLVWKREEPAEFELALEANIPDQLRKKLHNPKFNSIRYEVKLGKKAANGEILILAERATLRKTRSKQNSVRSLFPMPVEEPPTILSPLGSRETRTVFNKVPGGNDNYYSEVYQASGKGWMPAFKLAWIFA